MLHICVFIRIIVWKRLEDIHQNIGSMKKKKLRNVGGEEGPLEVSHLCGEDQCVNPEHICLERWRITNERKENCHGHGLSATCKHTPRCILQKGGNSRSTGYGKKKKNNDAN